MTVRQTTFSEFVAGSKPTGWPASYGSTRNTAGDNDKWIVVDDPTATGGKVLEFRPVGSDEYSLIWPDIPNTDHHRAQIRWKPKGQNGSDLRMYARAADVATSTATGYTLGVRSADLDINKYSAGTFSNFANDTGGYTATDGEWYRTECEVVGINPTTLRVKTWKEGETKPATWSQTGTAPQGAINDTDASDIESGGFGLFAFTPDDVVIDWIVHADAGEAPEFSAGATPTITDIDGGTEFTPGESHTLNGTNFSASGGSIVINGEAQTITNRTATAITFTGARGGNPYNQNLTLTYTDASSNTATLTVQQVPQSGAFAVTAASPNTTDDASLWSGLVDTSTGDPVTVVDGDQALVTDPNSLGNLTVTPAGEISADTEGDFVVQFWRASEGVWGTDQTVTFKVPAEPSVPNIDLKKKQNKRRRYTANLLGAWRNRFIGERDE